MPVFTETEEPVVPASVASTDREFYQRHLDAAEADLKRTKCKRMRKFYKRIIARQQENLKSCELSLDS